MLPSRASSTPTGSFTARLRVASPLRDCIVVGVATPEDGMVPVACVILQAGHSLTEELVARLKHLVHLEHGDAWVR